MRRSWRNAKQRDRALDATSAKTTQRTRPERHGHCWPVGRQHREVVATGGPSSRRIGQPRVAAVSYRPCKTGLGRVSKVVSDEGVAAGVSVLTVGGLPG